MSDIKVNDKRIFSKDGEINKDTKISGEAENKAVNKNKTEAENKKTKSQEQRPLPSASFGGLIIGLASTALMQLGEGLEAEDATSLDLAAAQHTIDIIALLEEKTKGNLNDEEKSLLATVLYDLRMKFLHVKSK